MEKFVKEERRYIWSSLPNKMEAIYTLPSIQIP
jgi:hypothetical protein